MNRRYNTPWWAPEGDGPLGSGPDNPQLNSRTSLLQRLCENGPLYAVETRYGGTKYGKVEVKDGRIFISNFKLKKPESTTETRFIPILQRLCENGPLYAVETRYGGTKYGKVEVKDGRIFISNFKLKKPESTAETRFIPFPELLSRFNNGSSELPKTVFLRVALNCGEPGVELIIETDGFSPRAKCCVLLCSALNGICYGRTTGVLLGVSVSHVHSAYHADNIERISEDDPKTLRMEGGVYGMGERDSSFDIQLKDQPLPFLNSHKFGVVVAGLQGLKGLRRFCFIAECGLVI